MGSSIFEKKIDVRVVKMNVIQGPAIFWYFTLGLLRNLVTYFTIEKLVVLTYCKVPGIRAIFKVKYFDRHVFVEFV